MATKAVEATTATATDETPDGFSVEERAAMKERPREVKVASRHGMWAKEGDAESAVLAQIAGLPEPDRALGERLHAIVKASAPSLAPKLWHGMPADARTGKVVCFFQAAQKFNTRCATFGFNHVANLDEGTCGQPPAP